MENRSSHLPERNGETTGTTGIAVTGLGCCSAAGWDVDSVRQTVESGRVCARTGAMDLFGPFAAGPVFLMDEAGIPPSSLNRLQELLGPVRPESLNRTMFLAMTAVSEALRQANLSPADLRGKRVGVALGTTVGCTFLNETYYKNWRNGTPQDDGPIFDYLAANLAEQTQRILRVAGPRIVVTNACASGTDAIGIALRWLRENVCDLAIAGGADGVSRVACHGFSSLMLVSKAPCRPFDADRDGLNLGEGAGVLIMESEESARNRGAFVQGWAKGYGSAGDAHHPTAPDPEGKGLQTAIRDACADAGVQLSDIVFINAHGTGTPANDAAESTALCRLGLAERPDCVVVSTKGATGHTLGAAGGIEAVLTICTLNAGTTFGSTGCTVPDPRLPLKVPTASESRMLSGRIGITESLAFGGGNSALVLEGTPR